VIKLRPKAMKYIYKKCLNAFGEQQKIENSLGINRQQLYKWKESRRRIPYNVLLKMLEISGIEKSFIQDAIIEKDFLREGMTKGKIAKIMSKRMKMRHVNFFRTNFIQS